MTARSRYEPSKDLDEQIARRVMHPAVDTFTSVARDWVRVNGPIDTGLLRSLAGKNPTVTEGTRTSGAFHSTRPADHDPNVDVAVFVEFGTRNMSPRRYMAAAARAASRQLRIGTFAMNPQP